jgi:ATP-dependent DNA helicase RecG
VASGTARVVVGTHALIQDKTVFNNLGLALVDEQHRFGVAQRGRLADKGARPDVLHMTATPIPRTLAITVYGGMDLSVIDEMPPGRQPVKTSRVPASKVADLYRYIMEQVAAGRQAYIICPLVDESENKDYLTPAIRHFQELSAGPLAGARAGLLHGRLDAREKEDVLRAFAAGEVDILFSTTVVEVGIDVPNATIMVVEDAPNFGLTQLHQLRGRVGRGAEQAHCFLLGTPTTEDGKRRLRILCDTADGFEIAEADLEMRGPGEFHGVRQTGLPDLRVADLVRDARLIARARRDAQALLAEDPALAAPGHELLARASARFMDAMG